MKTLGTIGFAAAAGLLLAGCMEGSGRNEAHMAPQVQRTVLGFFFMDEGAGVKLAYGAANSDDVGLMLQCRKGSGSVQLTDATGSAANPHLTLISSGQSAALPGRIEDGEAAPVLVAKTRADSAPLQAFRRSGQLEVVRSDGRYPIRASSDDRPSIERFFAACG